MKQISFLTFTIITTTLGAILIISFTMNRITRYTESHQQYYRIPMNSDIYHVKLETLEKALANAQAEITELKEINESNVKTFNDYVARNEDQTKRGNYLIEECWKSIETLQKSDN